MTEPIFFDTDCLSAFLWVGSENLIIQLYRDRIFLSQQVCDEIKRVSFLKERIDKLLISGLIRKISLPYGTPEADLYLKLVYSPDPGWTPVGKGEASAISLAKCNGGILARNNMKDIRQYIELYHLKHTTTADILVEAFYKGTITESQSNDIWQDMINRRRFLPAATFSDYLSRKP